MTSTELQIKNIVYEEFSKLISNIEGDFKTNFVKKRYNFLLSQLDETITANMVFVSSFESKSGFAIETCAKRIARLKFGDENVPAIVNPRNVKHNINPNTISGQIIVTDIDTDNGELRGNISTFRATNVAAGKGSSVKVKSFAPRQIQRRLFAALVTLSRKVFRPWHKWF